jgi:hypothetical protein
MSTSLINRFGGVIAASHPFHVFNNTPARIGFSHCQKLNWNFLSTAHVPPS